MAGLQRIGDGLAALGGARPEVLKAAPGARSRFVALGKGRVVSEGPVADLETRAVQELIAL